jgi:hypothetical protein
MLPPRVDVTIVTVSHEHWADLQANLPLVAAAAGGCTWQLVVVDNACEDRTADHVRVAFPAAEVIRNDRRRGFAANCNAAIARAAGRHVLLLNPDVRCAPGSIEALVRFLDAHPGVGVAGPKLLNPDGSLQWSCRRFSTPFLFLLRGLGLERGMERVPAQRRVLMQDWDHASERDVDWVLGAALMARREAMLDAGGLDEGYELYCEDQDWCHRMWRCGWSVYYVPQSVMTHVHRRASHRTFGRMKWVHARSKLRMFLKQGTSGRRPVAARAAASPATPVERAG